MITLVLHLIHTSELNRPHIYRRTSEESIRRYDQIFPLMVKGHLLTDDPPDAFRLDIEETDPSSFAPTRCLTCIDSASYQL